MASVDLLGAERVPLFVVSHRVAHECEAQRESAAPGQPQCVQVINQQTLGLFEQVPFLEVAGQREVGDRLVERAAVAERLVLAGGRANDAAVANCVAHDVCAASEPSRALRSAALDERPVGLERRDLPAGGAPGHVTVAGKAVRIGVEQRIRTRADVGAHREWDAERERVLRFGGANLMPARGKSTRKAPPTMVGSPPRPIHNPAAFFPGLPNYRQGKSDRVAGFASGRRISTP